MELLIGADPELFLMENDKFVSGHGVIPGTKDEPFPVEGGAVQVDGMALEFNINPAVNVDQFIGNINTVLAELRAMVPDQFDLSIAATADFDRRHMAEQPPEARVLGCDPDYDAYTGRQNPEPAAHSTMRAAGGHIHLGWTNDVDPMSGAHFQSCRDLAIQMDHFLGLHAVINDADTKRQQMYGKPGAFRPKPYGMEYRTLSNYWLLNPEFTQNIYSNAKRGFSLMVNDRFHARTFLAERFPNDETMKAPHVMQCGHKGHANYILELIGARRR